MLSESLLPDLLNLIDPVDLIILNHFTVVVDFIEFIIQTIINSIQEHDLTHFTIVLILNLFYFHFQLRPNLSILLKTYKLLSNLKSDAKMNQ